MNIIIFGNGAWGSAIASLLEENGIEYSYWQKNDVIPKDSILVWAIPTQKIRSVIDRDVQKEGRITLINCAKGIEKETHLLPYDIFREFWEGEMDYMSLLGPSFADEVKKRCQHSLI